MSFSIPVTASAMDQRAVLSLRVNTVTKSDVTVTLRDDDALVKRIDLDEAGLRGFNYHGAKPEEMISLKSLRTDVTFSVDVVGLTLNLTVTPDHLALSTFNYRQQPELSITRPARSAFLNYSVGIASQYGANFNTEMGTHLGIGMLESNSTFSGHGGNNGTTAQWIVDLPRSNERVSVGDVYFTTGDLGASVALLGVTSERYFGLNPGTVETVLPGIRGSVTSPATADVYVNGTLVRQEQLQPGQFDFQNLPIGTGPNNTQIVVTDAFGRQQAYDNYFYGSDQLLAPGVTDFQYGAGVPRSLFGSVPVLSGPILAGRYSAGLNPNLTAGGRIEANASLLSGGGEAIVRLNRGVLGVEAAASRTGISSGAAAAVSYQAISRKFDIGASLLLQSPFYATLSESAHADRPLVNTSLALSVPSSRGSISLAYSSILDRDNGSQRQWQLTRWTTLSSSTSLQIAANLTHTPLGNRFGVSTTLNLIPSRDMAAYISTSESSGGQRQIAASLLKSSPQQVDSLGYNIGFNSSSGSPLSAYGTAQYRGPYGTYFGNIDVGATGPASTSLQVAGGIVAIDGKVFPTQPLTDSYALVDAGGLSGVRVTANGIDEGRTNRLGYAIVPQLGSYYSNTVGIAPGDVPLNYSMDETTEDVVPEYRSGQVMHFRLKRVLPVTGAFTVVMGNRPIVPAYGIVKLRSEAGVATSDIGENGEFYFENLSPGTYQAQIRFKGGQCNFEIQIPATQAKFLRLGTLTCKDGVSS